MSVCRQRLLSKVTVSLSSNIEQYAKMGQDTSALGGRQFTTVIRYVFRTLWHQCRTIQKVRTDQNVLGQKCPFTVIYKTLEASSVVYCLGGRDGNVNATVVCRFAPSCFSQTEISTHIKRNYKSNSECVILFVQHIIALSVA